MRQVKKTTEFGEKNAASGPLVGATSPYTHELGYRQNWAREDHFTKKLTIPDVMCRGGKSNSSPHSADAPLSIF